MTLFELDSYGNPIITAESLTVASFLKLFERDKSRTKERVRSEYRYIFHMCNYMSNYIALNEEDKHIEALKDSGLPNNWLPDDDVKAAMATYLDRRDTDELLFLLAAKVAARKLRDFYHTVDLSDVDEKGRYTFSANTMGASLKNSAGIVQSLISLESAVKAKMNLSKKNKANKEIGMFEDPEAFKDFKMDESVTQIDQDDDE